MRRRRGQSSAVVQGQTTNYFLHHCRQWRFAAGWGPATLPALAAVPSDNGLPAGAVCVAVFATAKARGEEKERGSFGAALPPVSESGCEGAAPAKIAPNAPGGSVAGVYSAWAGALGFSCGSDRRFIAVGVERKR